MDLWRMARTYFHLDSWAEWSLIGWRILWNLPSLEFWKLQERFDVHWSFQSDTIHSPKNDSSWGDKILFHSWGKALCCKRLGSKRSKINDQIWRKNNYDHEVKLHSGHHKERSPSLENKSFTLTRALIGSFQRWRKDLVEY